MKLDLGVIKQLREETGAGMIDVKDALQEAGGDLSQAKEILRKKGLKIAAKKQERQAKQGVIDVYIHPPGKIAGLVVLLCETDFVARNEAFQKLAHELAKQVAAMSPKYISSAQTPAEEVSKEEQICRIQIEQEGKTGEVVNKILAGKMAKYYEQNCLLEQAWIIDDKRKIKDLIVEATAKLGEKIEVKQIARFEL